MANAPIVEIDDMDFNNFLTSTVDILEVYLKSANPRFGRFFTKANVSQRQLRTHIEFMKRVNQAIKDQVVDLDEHEYVLISLEELARLKGK